MKKILAMAIGMAALASIASAQTATYSQNAVGFINVEMKGGNLYALTIPFENMDPEGDGSWKFKELDFAVSAPNSSQVYFWDEVNQTWETVTKSRGAFNTEKSLNEGDFFFFRPSADLVVSLAGEVPAVASMSVDLSGSGNLSAVAYPYPVEKPFKDTALATSAPNTSQVYFWDEVNQTWETVTKSRGAFNTDKALQPGKAIFFRLAGEAQTWTANKDYDWPGPKMSE